MKPILLAGIFALGILFACSPSAPGADNEADRPTADSATFVGRVFDDNGALTGPITMHKVTRTDDEWRKELTPAQYRIVRKKGTELPGSGALLKNKEQGVYTCAACGLPLFSSKSKYESGTGWPSFFDSIAKTNVAEVSDGSLGMHRMEVLCARCGGHLGHVFEDGPAPTGLRYCVNSESLAFTPADELQQLADPAARAPQLSTAVFAGGCFWCVEAVFEELDGVTEVVSGYAGGKEETANYAAVCSGRTKHAEAVQITYDPSKISFEELLRVHFVTHDPTQLNRQGNDVGPQYRSAIFYSNDEEKAIAQAFIDDLTEQKVYRKPIVTTLEPLTGFYPAETYHQNYVCNNPNAGYVKWVALPKVEKVRKQFKQQLKAQSPLEKK